MGWTCHDCRKCRVSTLATGRGLAMGATHHTAGLLSIPQCHMATPYPHTGLDRTGTSHASVKRFIAETIATHKAESWGATLKPEVFVRLSFRWQANFSPSLLAVAKKNTKKVAVASTNTKKRFLIPISMKHFDRHFRCYVMIDKRVFLHANVF